MWKYYTGFVLSCSCTSKMLIEILVADRVLWGLALVPIRTSSSADAFLQWADALLPRVIGISPDAARRYSDPARREHYAATGLFFAEALPSVPEVAQAGFLHGVWEISLIRSLGLSPEVEAILSSCRRLWSIDKLDADVPERLFTDVLPTLSHAAGALLLVAKQILHLDADGTMSKHTAQFRHRAVPLDSELNSFQARFLDRRSQLAYMRSVVVPTAKFFGLWHFRNTAENLCLYYEDRPRFDALLDFALRSTASGEPSAQESRIRRILGDLDGIDVVWEWHHLGSLNRILSGPFTAWSSRLARCGMVTVVCGSPEAEAGEKCYRLLAKLHLDQDHNHQLAVEDYVGMPRSSGYQAIHTTISPGDGLHWQPFHQRADSDSRGSNRPALCRESAATRLDAATH